MINESFIDNRDQMIDSNGYFTFQLLFILSMMRSNVIDFYVYLFEFGWTLCDPSHIPRRRDILCLRGVI